MRMSEFDYDLPAERIAQEPIEPRDASRLMVVDRDTGVIEHETFRALPHYLEPGDLLVYNDTLVSARRLIGRKPSGGKVEVLFLAEVEPGKFEVLVRPGQRTKTGTMIDFGLGVSGRIVGATIYGGKVLEFVRQPDIATRLKELGSMPLPPYIKRPIVEEGRYQTVYGRTPGSAAAPTAGLHFTDRLLDEIRSKQVEVAGITLDVSVDTFRPVGVDNPVDHKMHGENFVVSNQTVEAINRCKGRIIAVGTTTVRALESAAVGPRKLNPGSGTTRIFVVPGYRFQIVDAMVTNFHMPRTTMLLMVAAMCGVEVLKRSYATALAEGYRFLSFGDGMLIISRSTNEKRRT